MKLVVYVYFKINKCKAVYGTQICYMRYNLTPMKSNLNAWDKFQIWNFVSFNYYIFSDHDKETLRYLQCNKDCMLMYNSSDNLDIIGYVDSNLRVAKTTWNLRHVIYIKWLEGQFYGKALKACYYCFLSHLGRVCNLLWGHLSSCVVENFCFSLHVVDSFQIALNLFWECFSDILF